MASVYKLPEGNVLITLSGGRTSAFMLFQILLANGGLPERVVIVFCNTGREMRQTLEFVRMVSVHFNVTIIWLEYRCRFTGAPHDPRNKVFDSAAHSFEVVSHNSASMDGEPFIELMNYFQYPPNREADFCSHELKTRTARRFCVEVLGWKNWTVAIGIRSDEANRALKKQPKERYRVWYPLIDAKVTKRDVSQFWNGMPFDLQLLDVNGVTPLGNCDGCFKKSEKKRAALARDYPERAAWWAAQEDRFSGEFREGEAWADLITYVERQGDWIFNAEDALCQASGGECFG